MLVYYEEEMLDYKTWRNIELFGGHLGHHFQEFYAAFIGGRPYSTSGRKTKFLALISYENGSLVKQYHLRVGSAMVRALETPILAMVRVGQGREENLWKMLKRSFAEDKSSSYPFNRIHTHQFVWGGFGVVRDEEESNFDDASSDIPNVVIPGEKSFMLQKFPFSILKSKRSEFLKNHPWELGVQPSFTRLRSRSTESEDVQDLEDILEKVAGENEERLTIPGELVGKCVHYDERSLVYHVMEEEGVESRIQLLDLWRGEWETEHHPPEDPLPGLVPSDGESNSDDDTDDDSEEDDDGELLLNAAHVQALAMAGVDSGDDLDDVTDDELFLHEESDEGEVVLDLPANADELNVDVAVDDEDQLEEDAMQYQASFKPPEIDEGHDMD